MLKFAGNCVLVLFLCYTSALAADNNVKSDLACPAVRSSGGWQDLFPLPCAKDSECKTLMGANFLCCSKVCTKGLRTSRAAPIFKSKASQNTSSINATSNSSSISPILVQTTVVPSSSAPPSITTSTSRPTTSTSTTSTTTTSTTTTTTTTTTARPTTTPTTLAPIPLPSLLVEGLPLAKPVKKVPATAAVKSIYDKYVCPKNLPFVIFPIPCEKNSQCRKSSGADHVCCEGRCVKGIVVKAPRIIAPQPTHRPLLGVIPRECPTEPLAEFLFEVQTCSSDADCWPRVCCPDGKRKYCRTAKARLDLVPVASQINAPVRAAERYIQCTPPPRRDLFPQPCNSALDCFPNLCCAENGKKHCRPPMRSFIALLASMSQRVGSTINSFRGLGGRNNT